MSEANSVKRSFNQMAAESLKEADPEVLGKSVIKTAELARASGLSAGQLLSEAAQNLPLQKKKALLSNLRPQGDDETWQDIKF